MVAVDVLGAGPQPVVGAGSQGLGATGGLSRLIRHPIGHVFRLLVSSLNTTDTRRSLIRRRDLVRLPTSEVGQIVRDQTRKIDPLGILRGHGTCTQVRGSCRVSRTRTWLRHAWTGSKS